MWEFVGEIDYVCEECNFEMSMPIDDFTIESMGGSERSMGPDNLIDISCDHSCSNCNNEINLHFQASEYPIGAISFIKDYSHGAEVLNEPDIADMDDSPIYLFPESAIITPGFISLAIPQLINYLKDNPLHLYQITPREFEEVVAEIFRGSGYSVELKQSTRDGGKDIIAIKSDSLGIETKYFIECKRHSETNTVGVDIVRSLYGVTSTRDGPNKSLIVTTSTFTSPAENEIPSRWEMSLIDYNQLLEWIRDYNFNPFNG